MKLELTIFSKFDKIFYKWSFFNPLRSVGVIGDVFIQALIIALILIQPYFGLVLVSLSGFLYLYNLFQTSD